MLEIVQSGGWLMAPIALASVVALGICLERAWTLRRGRVLPAPLCAALAEARDLSRVPPPSAGSELALVLAAGLDAADRGRERMRDAMALAAASAVQALERYLTTLGIVAAITPLLGLLGTVVGMIRVFRELVASGPGQAAALAGGIAEALVTTAAGLAVAIPALICHRYLLRKVDELTVALEAHARRALEVAFPDGPDGPGGSGGSDGAA